MLSHIVVYCVHYSFFDDNNGHMMRNFLLDEVGALPEGSASCPHLIRIHELHRGVVAHRDKTMEQSLDFHVFLSRPICFSSLLKYLVLNLLNNGETLLVF